MTERDRVIGEVERYWRGAGLSPDDVAEMKAELDQHLSDALMNGRTVDDVIGDRAGFAESWAAARRGRPVVRWDDFQSGKARRDRDTRRDLVFYGIGSAALLVAAYAVARQGGEQVDNEIWRWMWTILAVVMGIGEIFTAGFFLLPFAIGATAAAILAWLNVVVLAQWLVFFGVSIFSLAYLRRFIGRQDEGEQPRVGANRWKGELGVVLHDIDPHTGTGMVRVLNEEWRATAPQPIPAGSQIIVTEVQGARLVVERLES
jgi:membrane protein implicated in regulation of membrane protease activity